MKCSQTLLRYLRARVSENLRPGSIANINRTLRQFVAYARDCPVDAITRDLVRDYLANRLVTCSGGTVNDNRSTVLSFLRWASEEGFVADTNWAERIPRAKTDRHDPRVLTIDECRRLLIAVRTMPYRTRLAKRRDVALVYFLLDTGLRASEALSLRVADLDTTQRVARISAVCKGRSERIVVFSPETARLLRAYTRVRHPASSPWFWLTREGTRPSRGLLLANVKRIGYAAAIPDIHVHALRHTAITMLIRHGLSPVLAQQLAGHKRIESTMGYTHLSNDDLRQQYDAAAPITRLMA